MGQHGAALARGRGGGCEVFRALPSLGRQIEARQRAGRRAASESTVVDALLPTGPCLADPATPTDGLWLCGPGLKSPGSRLRPPFYGDVTFFYTVTAPPRPALPRSAPPRAAPPCAAPPVAPSLPQRRLRRADLCRDACAATPRTPRRLRRDACAPRRLTLRCRARRCLARGSASHHAAWPLRRRVSAPRRLVRT
jgi:hypothetical protein